MRAGGLLYAAECAVGAHEIAFEHAAGALDLLLPTVARVVERVGDALPRWSLKPVRRWASSQRYRTMARISESCRELKYSNTVLKLVHRAICDIPLPLQHHDKERHGAHSAR